MKTKLWFFAFVMIVAIPILISSCDKDEITYSTNDLKGVWEGNLRFEMGNDDFLRTTQFSFGDDGSFQSMGPDHPDYESISGNLTVSEDGEITGIITTTHLTHLNTHTETTSMDWKGSQFETKTKINVDMLWPWQNVGLESSAWGTVYITGMLIKQ